MSNSKSKPLQASTNIIHTKIPKRIDNLVFNKTRQGLAKQLSDPAPKKKAISHKTLKQSDIKSSQTPKIGENSVNKFERIGIKKTNTATPVEKVDENDMSAMVKNAYDPLKDVYPFDEELYQKVLKLELADDGLPKFEFEEPFEF